MLTIHREMFRLLKASRQATGGMLKGMWIHEKAGEYLNYTLYIATISLDMGRANTFAWLYRGEWTHFSRSMGRKRKHPDKSVKALVPELIKCPCVESEDLKSKLDNKCQRKVGQASFVLFGVRNKVMWHDLLSRSGFPNRNPTCREKVE